jgi:hypothetical protein
MRIWNLLYSVVGCVVLAVAAVAPALATEFTYFAEDFASDAANWRQSSFMDVLAHEPSGGLSGAGDGYVTTDRTFGQLSSGFGTPIIFRAQSNVGSSGGAYAGNWVQDQVVRVEAWVRHNFSQPVDFGARFASSANTPGASFNGSTAQPNEWTRLEFLIDPNNVFDAVTNPTGQIITFGGSDFAGVFDEIGNIQFTTSVPSGLSDTELQQTVTFDLDAVQIYAVPEPASLALALCGGVAVLVFGVRRSMAKC